MQDQQNPLIISDARLHHLGEVYLANPQIRQDGVLFYTFLLYPDEIMRVIFFDGTTDESASAMRDLLPAQDRVLIRTAALPTRAAA